MPFSPFHQAYSNSAQRKTVELDSPADAIVGWTHHGDRNAAVA
jgi:hypothetical protein